MRTAPRAAPDSTADRRRLSLRRRRFRLLVLGGLAGLALISLIGVLTGSTRLALADIAAVYAGHLRQLLAGGASAATTTTTMTIDPVHDAIVWSLRTPRVILAAMVGMALALAGAQMQGLFRNALASPGIVGTSAGASLGAVVCLATGLALQSPLFVPLFAIVGALLALLLVAKIATVEGRTPIATLLLAGVALTTFVGAINAWI